MKKLFITALVLSISLVGFSQKPETKPEADTTTMNTKANYNTTRSNKKSIKAPDDKTKKENKSEVKSSGGGQSVNHGISAIIDRKRMR
jgi:hypothetical protein